MGLLQNLVMWIVIGALAGLLTNVILRKSSKLEAADVVLGMVGAVVGGAIFRLANFHAVGLLAELVVATVGSILLVYLIRHVRGR